LLESLLSKSTAMSTVLVTGAAGFIGSHLADRLLDSGREVVGFDNLSSGQISNLARALQNPHFQFVRGDLLDREATMRALANSDLVFHLAADPEVRAGAQSPDAQFRQNLEATFSLLEVVRRRATPARLVFASTSTIYGEATVIPTPENYGPVLPISTYGATKLGCEALAASYTQLLPLQVVIFRFANVVGPRARHGVLYDFIMKLRKDPRRLEVLGDGTQTKSYLHVDDCVDAFLMALDEEFWTNSIDVYNIGSEDQTNVLTIASVVTDAMSLENVTTSVSAKPGERAWPGDIRTMLLDVSKIKRRGWKPKRDSDEAIRTAAVDLVRELNK
jgi:UDP-glucose 4-epimerase